MNELNDLIERNRDWSARLRASDPAFFSRLAGQQSPRYLWIGCSDSRVPATQLVGLAPGELFVHRNVANLVVHTDLNCLSVIQFAVEVLGVRHIIVCGHYGCNGVRAALSDARLGLIDNWLRHVQDVAHKHAAALADEEDDVRRARLLCELNVIEQVVNASQTTIVRQAWERGQELAIHGWIYGLEDGLVCDLNMSVTGREETAAIHHHAVHAVTKADVSSDAGEVRESTAATIGI